MVSFECRSPGKLKKRPKLGKKTEFHHEPPLLIPQIFMSHNTRGLDYGQGFSQGTVSRFDTIGGGLGLFVNTSMGDQWVGHKLFYYYIDLDIAPEHGGRDYPGDKRWIFSTYPGVYMRSYLPFWLKIHWGLGLNFRMGATDYDRWGIYTQIGLELFNFTASTIFVGHPGQSNIETEYRFGYVWAPFHW